MVCRRRLIKKKKQPEQVKAAPPAPIVLENRVAYEASVPQAAEPQRPSPATKPVATEEKKSFSSGKGWGSFKPTVAIPSLNTVFEEKIEDEEQESDLIQGSEFREVTFNAFIGKWNDLAERMKANNRITIYTIMTSNPPRLKGNIIEIDVENAIQSDQLREGKIDILNYLRPELQNFSLDIVTIQLEQTVIRKAYTSQEKYQVMATKNPALEVLRKTFNLGLS